MTILCDSLISYTTALKMLVFVHLRLILMCVYAFRSTKHILFFKVFSLTEGIYKLYKLRNVHFSICLINKTSNCWSKGAVESALFFPTASLYHYGCVTLLNGCWKCIRMNASSFSTIGWNHSLTGNNLRRKGRRPLFQLITLLSSMIASESFKGLFSFILRKRFGFLVLPDSKSVELDALMSISVYISQGWTISCFQSRAVPEYLWRSWENQPPTSSTGSSN